MFATWQKSSKAITKQHAQRIQEAIIGLGGDPVETKSWEQYASEFPPPPLTSQADILRYAASLEGGGAIGARAFVPDMAGLSDVSYLTNSSVMEVDFLPEHLVIIGGSYIGLEFAQIYRRFGSRVTVVEKGERLIARDDEDVSAAVKEIVENEGVEVRLRADCLAVEKRGEGVAVNLTCDEGPNEVEGSHLLLAVGRVPNTDDLGVDKAGLEMDGRGFIPVDDQLQTNVPGIWAIGDVNGLGAFTPPTMTMRFLLPTYSTAIRAGFQTGSSPMGCISTRRSDGSG